MTAEAKGSYQEIVERMMDGIVLLDLDGRCLYLNPTAVRLLARPKAETIGLALWEVMPGTVGAALRRELDRIVAGEEVLLFRSHFVQGGWYDIKASPTNARILLVFRDVTQRLEEEAARHQSEEQFQLLVDRVSDYAIFKLDLKGRIVTWNKGAERIEGYRGEEIIGKHFSIFYPPEDVEQGVPLRDLEIATTEGRAEREGWRVKKDGSRFWASAIITALRDRLGDPRGFAEVTRDMTERKHIEEALRASEAKVSGIIAVSADAIISIDEDQSITIFNEGAEKIFGYSKAEVIGAPLEMLIPVRFREIHRRHVATFAAGPVSARRMGERSNISGLRKTGEEFPAEASISRLKIGDKTVLTVAMRDITERTRIEREKQLLAEAGVRLAATLDYEQTLTTVADLVVRDFADWCLVDVTAEGEHPYFRRARVVGADPAKAALCAALEQMPIDRAQLVRLAETKQPLLIEHVTSKHLDSFAQGPEQMEVLRALDPRSLIALPLLTRGQFLGVLLFISSAPSRVYGQSDLPVAQALAAQAAAAIENARLYRASLQATQLRDQVLGIVAHDLRNPLSTILMQASALQRQGPEPERRSRKPAEAIRRAATRMNRLIQDLLDVALMTEGQLTVARGRISTPQLMFEAVEAQKPLASKSSLELRLEVAPDLPEVWGDRDRLLEVFENLIGNAIKFTGAGGRITVGAAWREHEVVFWVADSGCGIAPEKLPLVFERFWQAKRAAQAGAGLGLPIAKGIVEAHGGRIWAESAVGRGSTFFFTVPEAPPAEDRRSEAMPPAH